MQPSIRSAVRDQGVRVQEQKIVCYQFHRYVLCNCVLRLVMLSGGHASPSPSKSPFDEQNRTSTISSPPHIDYIISMFSAEKCNVSACYYTNCKL